MLMDYQHPIRYSCGFIPWTDPEVFNTIACTCFGSGFYDNTMFDLCDLAVPVIEGEGMCAGSLSHADVLVTSACDGLDLLLKPKHLRATLRT